MSERNLKKKKLDRVLRGETVKCLDLFSGCGGLSLGFHASGFEIAGAVEFDDLAAKSHAINFHKELPAELLVQYAQPRDITKEEPESLIKKLTGSISAEDAIDVIIGGPPCQAFARVGRAKLREVAEHPEAISLTLTSI